MDNLVEVKVSKQLGTIESNLDAVKASIEAYIADYNDYVVSEDTVKDSKALLADLRKQQKALDDERKQIKKDWNTPFTEWEKQAKEVIALYDSPIILINDQLLKFEEERKEKKRKVICGIYDECKGDLEEYLSLESIYDTKWENASVKESAIRESIQNRFEQVALSISTIKSMEHEFEDKGLEEYKRTLDMQAAISCMTRYAKQKEEILARQEAEKKAAEERARLEAERKEAEERAGLEAEQKAVEKKTEELSFPNVMPMEESFKVEEPFETVNEFATKEKMVRFSVQISESEAAAFEAYLQNKGYQYNMEV